MTFNTAATGLGRVSIDFLEQVRALGYADVSLGAKSNLTPRGGAKLSSARRGDQVWLESLTCTPPYVAWIDLPRKDGLKRCFVLSTVKGSVRTLLGRRARRWRSWAKTARVAPTRAPTPPSICHLKAFLDKHRQRGDRFVSLEVR